MTEVVEVKRCPFCGVAVNFGPESGIAGWHDGDCFFALLFAFLEEADEITEEMNEEGIHAAFLRAWNRRADDD